MLIFILLTQVLSAQAQTFKIGFVGPRTGSAAATGAAFDEGIQLALDKLRADPEYKKHPIDLIFEDSGGVPEKATAAFEKLATKDQVAIVVGESHSSSALAEIEVSNRTGVPFVISEAWSDDLLKKGYKTVFRAGPSNSAVVHGSIAKFIRDSKFKRVVVVAENSDWGKGIAALTDEALTHDHITHSVVSVDHEAKDFYAELNKLKNEKPDLIVAYIYSFGMHTFISQAREVGVHGLILDGAGPPSLWPEFWQNVGTAGNDELFVSCMHEKVQPNAQAKEFWTNYKKKFGHDPSDYKSRSAYTAVLLAADALKRAHAAVSADVIASLEKTNFHAAQGTIHFGNQGTEFHQWAPDMLVVQWQNGKPGDSSTPQHVQQVVYPKKLATGTMMTN